MSVARGKGRPRFNIPVDLICDTLRGTNSIKLTGLKLGCSRGYIYKELWKVHKTPAEILNPGTAYARLKEEGVLEK